MSRYLTRIFATIGVSGAEEDFGDGLEIGAIAIFVPPNGQLNLPQNGAFSSTCVFKHRTLFNDAIMTNGQWSSQQKLSTLRCPPIKKIRDFWRKMADEYSQDSQFKQVNGLLDVKY